MRVPWLISGKKLQDSRTVKHSSSPSLPANLTLGQKVDYIEQYTPELLQGVPRSLSREQIGVSQPLPFGGVDIWNGYELSWLNPKGKPQVAILQCQVPIDSQNLIESKSFKLYLNSFNQSVFGSADEVARHLSKDLSACAQGPVDVQLSSAGQFGDLHLGELDGLNYLIFDGPVSARWKDCVILAPALMFWLCSRLDS